MSDTGNEVMHTPTPWMVIQNDGAYVKEDQFAKFRIDTAPESGRDVAVALVITDTPELDNEANAAFIVRAVNAHDDLVAALEAAATVIEEAANIIRPKLPSVAENLFAPVAAQGL
jgi:hypothetical protein